MCTPLFVAASLALAASPVVSDCPANTQVTLHTSAGDVVICVEDAFAPQAAQRFVAYCQEGVYSGVSVREADDYFVYAGNYLAGGGLNSNGHEPIPQSETAPGVGYQRGTVGMRGASFRPGQEMDLFELAIARSTCHRWDGQCTIVGEVESGMEILDDLANRADGYTPDRPIEILNVTLSQ